MPWYVVLRNPSDNQVIGFLTDGDLNLPVNWGSKEDAQEVMKGHIFENSCDYIELD